MAGYILILAIIFLGGAIATLGDRIGTRVGKARLSLFNLRPKSTAVLVTIITGSLISTSTIGILLATNRQLRDAIFRIGEIQQQSREVQEELNRARAEKADVEEELSVSRAELTEAVRRLRRVNQSLTRAIARERESEAQLRILQRRYQSAQSDLRFATAQAQDLRTKIQRLGSEAQQLQLERQRLIAQRDQAQTRLQQAERQTQALENSVQQAQGRLQEVEEQKQQLEVAIAAATQQLATAEIQQRQLTEAVTTAQTQLEQANQQRQTLMAQRTRLEEEVAVLEGNRQRLEEGIGVLLLGLRQGNIAIRTGEILASGVIQVSSRPVAIQALNSLLQQAQRSAIRLINPQSLSPDQQVVQMTNADVESLLTQITDGQSYVIRILSAANYLEGEQAVLAIPEVAPNQRLFQRGEIISSINLNPEELTDEQLINRLELLFSSANRRAIESGVLPNPVTGTVGSFSNIDLFRFILALKEQSLSENIQINAVVSEPIYPLGPLTLELIAIKNQQIILRSS